MTLLVAPPPVVPTGDERDYLRAAAHLRRDGVFSHVPLEQLRPPADVYREPGYAFLLATWWRATGVPPSFDEQALVSGEDGAAARGVRHVGALLLLAAAIAAAAAAHGAGARPLVAAVVGVLVLASPVLRQASLTAGSEGLAAALTTAAGAGLVALVAGAGAPVLLLAGLATGLLPLVRGAGIVLAPAGALLLLATPRDWPLRRRLARATVFALLALAPALLWGVRNRSVSGHWVLADRGGAVFQVRLELDREIAREGLLPALALWTPLDAAQELAESRWPGARYARYEWEGEGNYFTRAVRSWRAARAAAGDPLEVDRELGREALAAFVRNPGDHLLATVAVAWRGLFAERAPATFAFLDRSWGWSLVIGLLLCAGFATAALRALRERDAARLALLLVPASLFLLHAWATEFLPRFDVPALPLVWAAVVVAWSGGRTGQVGR